MQLSETEADAWRQVEEAASDPESGFRYMTLCSVDDSSRPQARTLVVRRVDPIKREVEFHTDTRSPKWAEIRSNPHIAIHGFCPRTKMQLRFSGTAALYGADTEQANAAWETMPPWTRSTYTGGPPGDERAFEADAPAPQIDPDSHASGQDVFGVFVAKIES